MNPEVVLRIDALDNTRAAMDSVKRNLDGVKQQTRGFQDRVRDLQPTFRRMAAVGTAAFAGLTFGIGKAVDAAGRAQDIEALFNLAFTDTEDRMNRFVDEFSAEFGRATTNVRQMASDMGFALSMGTDIGSEGIADMTEELVFAAEALALTDSRIKDGQQAMQAFAGAMNGNTQQIRQYIPTIREANIEEQARTMGLIEQGEQLDQTNRAIALQALIMEGTTKSQERLRTAEGDYTDTKQRLNATIQETTETLGEAFLPIATKVMNAIQPIVERIASWIEENEELATKIGVGLVAITGLIAAIGVLGMALLPLISAFKVAAVVIAAIASPIGIIIALLGVITATIAYLALNWEEHWDNIKWAAGEAISWLGERLEGAKNMLRGFANFFIGIGEGIGNSWIRMVNGIIDALNRIQISIPSWVPGLGGKSFGINIPNVPELNIPRLADGGIVTRSTLANIGEAGPEAVIPLDRMGDFGGGDTYNIYVNGTFADDRETARRVGSEIMHQLKHQRRLTSA